MTDYPNILRVAQCSSPDLPKFEAFFSTFESNVVAKIGATAIADSSLNALVDPDWKKYQIAPMDSWKQACFQVANSYLDQDRVSVGFVEVKDINNINYFLGAVVIELLQEWVLVVDAIGTFQPFGTWLKDAHRIVCPECGEGGLDRTDEGWVKCVDDDCVWIDADDKERPSNLFPQFALELLQGRVWHFGTVEGSSSISPFEPMMDAIGEAFLDTCIELGLGKDLHRSLINRRQLR